MNQFDQPAQSNIVNTYVPMPFNELLQAGAARQGRYDQGIAQMEGGQDFLDQIQAIPGEHEGYLNNAKQKYNELASKYSKVDLSQSYNRRAFKDEMKRSIDPSTINRIVQSRKNFEDAQKLKAEYDMRGLLYAPYDQAMDPALNGSLKASQLYDYKPSAFQDPEKVVGEYFKNIQPNKRVVTGSDGMIKEVVSRSLPQLQGAVANDFRTFADTPQGQWVVSQYKKNNPGSTLDSDDIVKGYMNDVAKRYVIDNQEDYVGYDPEAKARASASNKKNTLYQASSNVVIPGVQEMLPEQERIYGKNQQSILGLNSNIESMQSALRNTKIGAEQRKQTEFQLQSALSERDKLVSLQTDIFNKADLSYNSESIQAVRTSLNDVSGLSKKDADITFEIGKMLSDTHYHFGEDLTGAFVDGFGNRSERADKYLKEKYPNITSKERRQILNRAEGVYSKLQDLQPSRREKKQAFKDFAKTEESHPSVLPYTTATKSGVDYIKNPISGDFDIPSEAQQLLKGIQNNSDHFQIELYDGKNFVSAKNKKELDAFNAGNGMEYVNMPIVPNKDGQYQLEFRLKDKEGKTGKDIYRVNLSDPSQIRSLSNDYKNASLFPYTGVMDDNFYKSYALAPEHSYIASSYMVQKKQDVKDIPLVNTNGSPISFYVRTNATGTQDITMANGEKVSYKMPNGNEKPLGNYGTDEEVIQALIELQMNLDPQLIQHVENTSNPLQK